MDTEHSDATAALAARLQQLEKRELEHLRRVAELEQEVAALRAERQKIQRAPNSRDTVGRKTTRRRVLGAAGVVAAAAVGAGALVVETGKGTAYADNAASFTSSVSSVPAVTASNSAGGTGVLGDGLGDGVGGTFRGRAPVLLTPAFVPGPPTSGAFAAGEIYLDSGAQMYVCNATGDFKTSFPPSFYRLSSFSFLSSPIRILDTRPGYAAVITPGHPIAGGTIYTVPIAGTSANGMYVPFGITAAVLNVTAVNPSGSGDLILYPASTALPGTATLHYEAGQVVSNGAIVRVSAPNESGEARSGQIYIYVNVSTTDVVLDLAGYII